MRIKRLFGVLFSLYLLILAGCAAVSGPPVPPPEATAPPYDMVIEGNPGDGIIMARGGFYIWKAGNSWHVRAAKASASAARDLYVGSIRVENGFITGMERWNPRRLDVVRPDMYAINFSFETERGLVTGLDFNVRPALSSQYCIDIDVQSNGVADPQFVHLGRTALVPFRVPLRICFI